MNVIQYCWVCCEPGARVQRRFTEKSVWCLFGPPLQHESTVAGQRCRLLAVVRVDLVVRQVFSYTETPIGLDVLSLVAVIYIFMRVQKGLFKLRRTRIT